MMESELLTISVVTWLGSIKTGGDIVSIRVKDTSCYSGLTLIHIDGFIESILLKEGTLLHPSVLRCDKSCMSQNSK